MGFAHSEVKQLKGVPVIHVDGQPLHGMTATSCAFNDPKVIRGFVDGGCEIMMIWIEAGIECCYGPGQYDWTYAEKKLRLFEEHSGDTKWIIRVRLGLLGPWFKHRFPKEVHNPPKTPDEDGLSVSNIASPVWRDQVCAIVRDFATWLKDTRWASRIIGFMLNAGSSEEWLIFDTDKTYRGDYHPVYTREFRNWLRRAYKGDVEALQEAWSGHEVTHVLHGPNPADRKPTFETALSPGGHIRKGSHIWGPYSLREPLYERPMIDYYHFLNETVADHLIAVCRAAKEAAGTPIICGGFHSYLWWETGVYSYIQEYGHGLIQRLLDSEWVDFTSDIASYDARYPGGPSGYLGLPHTHNVHGKLHYTEVDLVTINQLPQDMRDAWAKADTSAVLPRSAEPVLSDREWAWGRNYCGRTMDEQVAILQREHMHNLVTGTAYWWFDIRQYDYALPELVTAMKELSDIGKQAVDWDRRTACDVAFIVSEDTPMFQAAANGELMRFELEDKHGLLIDGCNRKWGVAGIPFDIYELHDLAHPDFPGDNYKLFVFVNCAMISAAAAAGIQRWQNNGRVFCWTYAAGVTGYDGLRADKSADLIGMRLGWRNARQQIHVTMDSADHPLTKQGNSLDFGTEGSVGPVFFVDDPAATVFGHLRDSGEAAFAVREHDGWRSVYLAMLNFGPQMLRNLTAFAGGDLWLETDDVVYANRSIVVLHTVSKGLKALRLPAKAHITDLWTGERSADAVDRIEIDMPARRTQAWRTEYVAQPEYENDYL